ncbi:MAG TPA: YigZ family protein [Bacteroidia bacterium]|jgi:uncharacterized YigZ family protein|nr:YigZ family protein [Bacteroidia bacterium]
MNLFEDTYLTLAKPGEAIYRDRGSRFLAFSFPVNSEAQVKDHLLLLRKLHPGANHHCFAFRLGASKQFFRANDDGEPSGTAGRPILGQIQSKDLTNVLVVVVRYFGGILLGVGGLIQAYKQAAAEAIAASSCLEKTVKEVYRLYFGYDAMNKVMKIIKDNHLEQHEPDFGLECLLTIAVRKSEAERISELFRQIEGLKLAFLLEE